MTSAVGTPGLGREHLETWAALATLLERLPAALDVQLQRDSGLTHFEHGLLFALDTAPDRTLRMSILAGYASSTLSRLSRAITRLERQGRVRRTTDPSDGRFTLAVLTDGGHDLVQRSTPAHHALVEELVFSPLTDAQVRQLSVIAGKIGAGVGSAGAWAPPSTDPAAH